MRVKLLSFFSKSGDSFFCIDYFSKQTYYIRYREWIILLNPRQRHFRKKMKQINRERRVQGYKEPYQLEQERPSYQNRKPLFVVGSALGTVVLIWNLYALLTWIFPGQLPTPPTAISSPSFDTSEETIHFYLEKTRNINQELVNHLNETKTVVGTNGSPEKLEMIQADIVALKTQIETNDRRVRSLKEHYEEQIDIANRMVEEIKTHEKNPTVSTNYNVMTLTNQLNENIAQTQTVVVSILQSARMDYRINKDGTVSYKYKDSYMEMPKAN